MTMRKKTCPKLANGNIITTNTCLGYIVIAAKRHHDGSNLSKKMFIGAHGSRGLESTTSMVRNVAAGRGAPEQQDYSLMYKPKAERELARNLKFHLPVPHLFQKTPNHSQTVPPCLNSLPGFIFLQMPKIITP